MHCLLQRLFVVVILLSVHLKANAQCPAFDFSAGQTRVCQYREVFFTALNVPSGSNYTWIFGTDTVQGTSFQSHIFNGTGKFKVGLVITLPNSQVCMVVKPNYITVGAPPPGITIQASKTLLCDVNDSVTFTGSANNIVKWDWSIGNSFFPNSTPQRTHTFTQAGYYTVSLRAIDSNGCEVLQTIDSMVRVVKKPAFSFVANDTQFCAPKNLNFSYKPDLTNSQSISGWSWNFPGGIPSTSTVQNPAIINYGGSGNYDVGLRVTSSAGCSYSLTKSKYITTGVKKNLGLTASSRYICDRENISIKINATGLDTSKLKWDLTGATVSNKSKPDSQIVNYRQPGKHVVKATYTDNLCTTVTADTVEVVKLTPDITSDISCSCILPATVNYLANSPYSGTGTLNYLWTLYGSNGSTVIQTGTNTAISQVYTMPGNYNVSLEVNDGKGCSKVITKKPYARFGSLSASVLAKPNKVCKGQLVTFSTDDKTICKTAISSYQWTFYAKDSVTILGTSSAAQPQFSFPDTGSYNVKLIINGGNCNDTVLAKKVVDVFPLNVSLQVSDSVGCVGEEITFTPQSNTLLKPTFMLLIKNSLNGNTYFNKGIKTATNIIFTQGGTYDVFLIAKMANACIDTVKKINYIKVTDLTGNIKVQDSLGCVPLVTQARPNLNYMGTSNGFSFRWSSSSSDVVFDDTTAEFPILNINKIGCYPLYLKVTNTLGCEFNFTNTKAVCAGVKAIIDSKGGSCIDVPVRLKNQSTGYPKRYQWKSLDGGQFLPSDTVFEPEFVASVPGNYNIQLLVESQFGCSDSTTANLVIQDFQVDFVSPDTAGRCSPAFITFNVQANYADSFFWNFDDGQTVATDQAIISHVFDLQNLSVFKDQFDIILVAQSKFGCRDTVKKEKYITVFGPFMNFQLLNNTGCDPITVGFTNNSQNLASFIFDFGDGSPYLKDEITQHTYYSAGTDWYSVYHPTIVATDNKGCVQSYTSKDSIVVYTNPKAAFTVDSSAKCEPASVQVNDQSPFATNWFWDFDHNGMVDDLNQNPVPILMEGIYRFKLKVTNNYGCSDSLVAADKLEVFSKPKANFSYSRNYLCFGETIVFTGKSTGRYAIAKHHWDFGEAGLDDDTSNSAVANYIYTKPGKFDISYKVQDVNGCWDSLGKSKIIEVADTVPLVYAGVKNVTISKDSLVQISWPISSINHFGRYNIWRNSGSGWVIINSISNNGIGDYLDNTSNIHKVSYYRVQVVDSCGNTSSLGDSLPNIYLQTSNAVKNQIALTWNSLNGNVNEYRIYRILGNNKILLTTLDGTSTSFVDRFLCDETYCYYIEALHSGLTSVSNLSCIRVNYQYQQTPAVLRYVTVENNEYVKIGWQASLQPNMKRYVVQRQDVNYPWKDYYTTHDTFLIDNNTSPQKKYYLYRIEVEDSCGNLSEHSNLGSSILLKAFGEEDVVLLTWNSYETFVNGVDRYEIYRQGKNGQFELIQFVSANVNRYEDVTLNKSCYLVKAIENLTGIESRSNIACEGIASRVWVPTAFSPNEDGINDTLMPVLVSIEADPDWPLGEKYQFCVYDRWGRKMFETDSPGQGWDGLFNDQLQPEGAYFWKIKATGTDGRIWFVSGNVSLLR